MAHWPWKTLDGVHETHRMTFAFHSRPRVFLAKDDGARSGAGGTGGADDSSLAGAAGSPGSSDAGPTMPDAETAALKAEAQKLRARARAAEQERDQLKAAQQTDAEKLADRAKKAEEKAQKLEWRLRTQALRNAISEQATSVGIVAAPSTIARLIDPESIEWGDDGEPDSKTVIAALRALAKSDPALVRQGGSDGAAGGNRNASVTSMNDILRRKAGRAA